MTENFENSIVANERAQAPAQRALLASEALRHSGFDYHTPEDLVTLTKRFEPLADMQRAPEDYARQIYELADDPDAGADEERFEKYAEIREAAVSRHEELSSQLREQIEGERSRVINSLFGLGSADMPMASEPERAAAKSAYREQVYKLSKQPEENLREVFETASYIGDRTTQKAVAAIASKRGMHALAREYLNTRPEQDQARYAALTTTPRGEHLDTLLGVFEPRPVRKEEVQASPRAKKARQEREVQQSYRKIALFRR